MNQSANLSGHSDILFDFAHETTAWKTVNDLVMGGYSSSTFKVEDGIGIFSGTLSLKNNGGFASVRSDPRSLGLKSDCSLLVRLRGDGRQYSLNLYLPTERTAFSYRTKFSTLSNEWQQIEFPLHKFVASSFGREIPEMGAVRPEDVVSVGFLLGDKVAGTFRLEIQWIKLKRGIKS